ncbi:hypothetical protein ACIQMJ_17610 [Actinosynnema sp. NPDC091369]
MARHGLVQALEHFEHVDTRCLLGDLCARHAQAQLIDLLARRGEAGRARWLASRGPVADQRHQALLLWQYDFPEHAEAVLQPLSDAGDLRSTRYRTDLLTRPALPLAPSQSVESYNPPEARYRLANFLAEHEMVDELRELAASGYEYGNWRLLNLLAEQGDVRPRTELADTGHVNACRRLAEILARQGRVAELRARVLRGDVAAKDELVWLSTAKRTGSAEAAQLLRHGLDPEGTLGLSAW